jgi:hypothetical protein
MSFPSSIDDLSATRATSGTDKLSSPDHLVHHTAEDTAIEAVETKVGVDNSSVPNTIDYYLRNPASRNPGHLHTFMYGPYALAPDHSTTGQKVQLQAGDAMNFGDIGYIDSTGKVKLGDADAIATASCILMCADASIASGAVGTFLVIGIARDDSWNWTIGGLIYLSTTGTTGNTLTQTAPSGTDDVIQIVGVAVSNDIIFFNPPLVQVEHT